MLFGCVVLLGTTSFAGQEVRLFVDAEEAGASEPRPSALRRALAQGVVQEADVLLRGELGEQRLAVLRQILEPRADEYVLGWEELEYLPTEWGAVLHLEVRVNREALRGFLQSLGIYSTRGRVTGYHLDAQNLGAEWMPMVRNLEQLSGLREDGSNALVLRLGILSDGGWQGVLDYEGLVWTATGRDLPEVWAGLWGNYFQLDRVRQGFEDTLTLVTQGWNSAGEIQAFDRQLRGLEVSMDRIDLLGLFSQAGRYEARWRIVTMDPDGVKTQVQGLIQNQPATFSFQ